MRTFLALSILLALTLPAAAEPCFPTTSHPEITIPETFVYPARYIDNDLCQFDEKDPNDPYGGPCLFSIWSYSEGNGIEGLQRGDEVVDDTCGGMIESDTLDPY